MNSSLFQCNHSTFATSPNVDQICFDWLSQNETGTVPPKEAREQDHSQPSTKQYGAVAAFNEKYHPAEILLRNGYIKKSDKFLSPHSESGSAGVNILDDEKAYSHHGESDPLSDGKPHDAFDCFRILECDGDYKAAFQKAEDLLGIDPQDETIEAFRKAGLFTDALPTVPTPVFNPFVQLKQELLPVKPPPDLSLHGSSTVIDKFVLSESERIGAAPEFILVGVLASLSILVAGKVVIAPKENDSWTVSPNLWGLCVGRPSSRKSPALDRATSFVNKIDHRLREHYQYELKDYAITEKINGIQQSQAKKSAEALIKAECSNDDERLHNIAEAKFILEQAEQLNEAKPRERRLVVHDATVEKTAVLLEQNPTGLITVVDELSSLLNRLDREENSAERGFTLTAFNGNQPYSYDRIGRESVYIPNCILSIVGGIQPSKLEPYMLKLASGDGDDGLLQRFQLAVYPDFDKPKVTDLAEDKTLTYQLEQVYNKVSGIQISDSRITMRFDEEAQAVFDQYQQDCSDRMFMEVGNPSMESHLGKYPAFVASLACILHLTVLSQNDRIKNDSMCSAIALADFFESHARRIYALGYDATYAARSLVERISGLDAPFTARDVQRKGWAGLTDKADVSKALDLLIERGYLAKMVKDSDRGRPSTQFHINPEVWG